MSNEPEDEWLVVDEQHAKLLATLPPHRRPLMREALGVVTDMARCIQRESKLLIGCSDPAHRHTVLPASEARALANEFLRFAAAYGFNNARDILDGLATLQTQPPKKKPRKVVKKTKRGRR